jgi:plasmid stabilization system protein ParE
MGQVVWSTFAEISLAEIWSFYAKNNIPAAEKVVEEIINAVEEIKYSKQFQREEFLEGKYRRAIVRHFKIIYVEENQVLRIIDVFDTRQDPKKIKRNK